MLNFSALKFVLLFNFLIKIWSFRKQQSLSFYNSAKRAFCHIYQLPLNFCLKKTILPLSGVSCFSLPIESAEIFLLSVWPWHPEELWPPVPSTLEWTGDAWESEKESVFDWVRRFLLWAADRVRLSAADGSLLVWLRSLHLNYEKELPVKTIILKDEFI